MNLNQLSLPFNEVRAQALSYENRAKTFWVLSAICLCSFISYIYAVNATARYVAQRSALEQEAADLHADLATLEFQYIAMTSDITLETAAQYGFTEVREPLYVAKDGAPALSFNTPRP